MPHHGRRTLASTPPCCVVCDWQNARRMRCDATAHRYRVYVACDCSALWPLLPIELVQIIFELLDDLEDLLQS